MAYWLLIHLFTPEGEFFSKDIYEAVSKEQCVELARDYTRTIINTNYTAQFNCVSDEEYKAMTGEQK